MVNLLLIVFNFFNNKVVIKVIKIIILIRGIKVVEKAIVFVFLFL